MKTHVALFLLLAACAYAGPRTSANYSITADTTDGARVVRAARARGAFAAVAARTNVNETATLQPGAWLALDDATEAALQKACGVTLTPAQDFPAQFPLNADDKSLNDADLHGVALAAIQGLNQKVEEQQAELKQQQTEITEMKHELTELKNQMKSLTHKLNGGAR